jgi:protein kinase-like protein
VPAPALNRLVRECGPLPVAAVRWLAAGCAEALESIHGSGLVHRDLKPSNVLVSPDGPRVIDFGVARAVERIQLTVTRGAVGTPAYMAPEQARDTRQATMSSDVFSLGATMLFAATGHAPYQGETVMDVLVRLATEPPDLSGLPADLADIVRACLQRDPRMRPSSAAVLAQLAPSLSVADADHSLGASVLPGPALALIAEYRRNLRPSAGQGPQDNGEATDDGEDATFGSQPAPVQRSAPSGPGRARQRLPPAGRRRRAVLVTGSAVAAAALVSAGTAVGFAAADSGRPSLPPPPPPNTIMVPAAQASLSTQQAARPQLALYQSLGDSSTVFVLHGIGWPPGQRVTVALSGRDSPEHPVVDNAGTFSYAINQNHEFFRRGLRPGRYRAVASVPGGARAGANFTVIPPQPGGGSPPPGSGPPGGSGPPEG